MITAARWHEMSFEDSRVVSYDDLYIRTISEIETTAKTIVDTLYFESADILRCYSGRFRFTFSDHEPVEIGPGEVLITFPRRYVSITALETNNRLVYGIIGGAGVEEYLESLGACDCLKGRTASHYESIMELSRQLALPSAGTDNGRRKCLGFLTDIIETQIKELGEGKNGIVFDAIRLINKEVRSGVVRLNSICERLGVSRSYLHRMFTSLGLGKPSDYIRKVQLRYALSLIHGTKLTVAEIALRVGFKSPAPFIYFIKELTGSTPTQLRHRSLSI